MPLLVSAQNGIWGMFVEIPYWSRVTTQNCVVLLIGWVPQTSFRRKKHWWHHKMVAVFSGQWFLSIKNNIKVHDWCHWQDTLWNLHIAICSFINVVFSGLYYTATAVYSLILRIFRGNGKQFGAEHLKIFTLTSLLFGNTTYINYIC